MGVYFEDKLLRAKEDGDELEQMYYEGLKEIEQEFKKKGGVIVLRREHEEKKDTTGTNSMPAPPIALPVTVPMYVDSLGAINVRYSKSSPQKTNDGKTIIYPSSRLFVYENLILTERDKDLAWFMLKATSFIEKDNVFNPSAFLKIDDPVKEVAEKASKLKRIAQVDAHLLYEDSVLFNKQSIQAIADRFGIDAKEGEPIEITAYSIREAVVNGEKSRNSDINIELFLDFAGKMKNKLEKNSKKKGEAKDDEKKASEDKADPVELEYGKYTEEYLNKLVPVDRNEISKKLELDYPPNCKKEEQVRQILERQAIDASS
jgi:hypothetical protein